ncbi:MAG: hypothetical protein IT378_17655 [Sandaracinaceae bacterium]|nr:hypothetical protein [Sandaracinaceae bacterium]
MQLIRPIAALLWLSLASACLTPGQVLDPDDGGEPCAADYREAPAPAFTCAPFFEPPIEPPANETAAVTHAAGGDVLVDGSHVELMRSTGGMTVVPLAIPLPGSDFVCYRIVATVTIDGVTIETPAEQLLSSVDNDHRLVFHVRVPDAPGRVADVSVTFQQSSLRYTRWSRSLVLEAPQAPCPIACEPLAQRFSARRSGLADDLRECTSPADCAMVAPQLTCSDSATLIADCPIALRADAAADYRARLALLRPAFCFGAVCMASPSCQSQQADCVSGTCTAVTP